VERIELLTHIQLQDLMNMAHAYNFFKLRHRLLLGCLQLDFV